MPFGTAPSPDSHASNDCVAHEKRLHMSAAVGIDQALSTETLGSITAAVATAAAITTTARATTAAAVAATTRATTTATAVAAATRAACATAVTAATIATATRTAAAKPARALFTRTSLIDDQCTAFHLLTVHAIDGRLRFGIGAHLDESKTFGATGFTVHHHLRRQHSAKLRESLMQVVITYAVRQVTDVEFVAHCERLSFTENTE